MASAQVGATSDLAEAAAHVGRIVELVEQLQHARVQQDAGQYAAHLDSLRREHDQHGAAVARAVARLTWGTPDAPTESAELDALRRERQQLCQALTAQKAALKQQIDALRQLLGTTMLAHQGSTSSSAGGAVTQMIID